MRDKYPEYNLVIQNFIQADPLAEVRRNVDIARLKRHGSRFILMINHHLGGGTEKHFQDISNLLNLESISVLMLKPDPKSPAWVELSSPKFKSGLLAKYHITMNFKCLIKDLKSLGVFHVHIHHIIGLTKLFKKKLKT
ncbi:MAG TPA: hypothetical protein IGS17_11190 [Oscillatoriales cyanobacterium M59_W2019_021]|nr:hypothetical protein [Oscillatoriales cyanobacterium M59_W2019_021]